MRYTTIFLFVLLFFGTSMHGQVQMLNPTTHPFSVNDMEIFPGGLAYMVSGEAPFMVKLPNIHKPTQGKPVYVYLNGLNITELKCPDPMNCLGWVNGKKAYRSSNGGRSWARVALLDNKYVTNQGFRRITYVNDRFILINDQFKDTLMRSSNMGRSASPYSNVPKSLDNIAGHNDRFAFYRNKTADTLYQVSPGQVRFFASAAQFPGIDRFWSITPTSKGYIIEDDSSEFFLVNLSLSNVRPLFDLQYPEILGASNDTMAIIAYASRRKVRLLKTFDGGVTWQDDTISWYAQNKLFSSTGVGRRVFTDYQRGKFFNGTGLHGTWEIFDILNSKVLLENTNRYFASSMFLARRDSDSYVFDNEVIDLKDSTRQLIFLNAHGKEQKRRKAKMPQLNLFQPTNFNATFHLRFMNSQYGVGYQIGQGNFIVTHDGGDHWSFKHIDSLKLPASRESHLQMLPALNEVLVTKNNHLLFLDTSFQLLSRQRSSKSIINARDFYFKNRQEGIVTTDRELWYTSDGGKTYRKKLDWRNGGPTNIRRLEVYPSGYYVLGSASIYHSPTIDGTYKPLVNLWTPQKPFLNNYHLTSRLNILDYDKGRSKLHYSADTGNTFQSATFFAEGDLNSVWQTTDSTYLLSAEGGQLFLLEVTDSLIIADSSSNFIPVNFGNDTNAVGLSQPQVENIAFFPNPAQQQLTLQFTDAQPRTLKIYDLQGRLQLSRKVQAQQVKLPIAELPGGMYVLQVHLPQGGVKAMKFLKME